MSWKEKKKVQRNRSFHLSLRLKKQLLWGFSLLIKSIWDNGVIWRNKKLNKLNSVRICYKNTALRTRRWWGRLAGPRSIGQRRVGNQEGRNPRNPVLRGRCDLDRVGAGSGHHGAGSTHRADLFRGLQPAEQRVDGWTEPASAYAEESCLTVKNTASAPPPHQESDPRLLSCKTPRPTPCPLSPREVMAETPSRPAAFRDFLT